MPGRLSHPQNCFWSSDAYNLCGMLLGIHLSAPMLWNISDRKSWEIGASVKRLNDRVERQPGRSNEWVLRTLSHGLMRLKGYSYLQEAGLTLTQELPYIMLVSMSCRSFS